MKRHIIKMILLSSIIMISCDPILYMNMYVQNNCEQSIIVTYTTSGYYDKVQTNIDTVNPYSQEVIYNCETIIRFTRGAIPIYLQEMKITKNGKNILYNPLDTTKWVLTQSNKYNYEAVITINSEDFE